MSFKFDFTPSLRSTSNTRTVRRYFEKKYRILFNSLLVKQGNKCFYCEERFFSKQDLTLDHLQSIRLNGDNDERNIVIACQSCNTLKSIEEKKIIEGLKNREMRTRKVG